MPELHVGEECEYGVNRGHIIGIIFKTQLPGSCEQKQAFKNEWLPISPITRYWEVLWIPHANVHLVSTPDQASLAKWCLYQAPGHT